jgi:Domain of Unknown Function (DUF1080)
MQKRVAVLALLLLAVRLDAAERRFDFSTAPTNAPPPGCTPAVSGDGKPGGWMVLLDAVPQESNVFTITSTDSSNLLAPASGTHLTLKSVVGQVARDTTDNHYPMLMLGDQSYGDFTFTTRFKIAGGDTEQIAGVAFRVQDEKNYYVARANVHSGTFYFYTVVKGMHTPPIGNNVKFKTGDWHELTVQCQGTEIRLKLDGRDAMPPLNDPTFSAGRIALWTKSDSVAYFTDTAVSYTPKVNFAQHLVDDTMEEYPRLLGLQLYVPAPAPSGTKMIASNDGKGIGDAGEAADADVIQRGVYYLKRGPDMLVVTMPLNDRNGDPVAAVRVMLRPVPGQTEENARIRALPIIKTMQKRMSAVHSLTE